MRTPVRLWRLIHLRRYRRLKRLAGRSADSFPIEILAVRRPSAIGRLLRSPRIVIPSVSGLAPAVAVTMFRGQDLQNLDGVRTVRVQGSRDGTGPVVVSADGLPPLLGLGRDFDPAKPTLADRLRSAGRFVLASPRVLSAAIRSTLLGLMRLVPRLVRGTTEAVKRATLVWARWTRRLLGGAPRVMRIIVSAPPKLVVLTFRAIGRASLRLAEATVRLVAGLPRLAHWALSGAVQVAWDAVTLLAAAVRSAPRLIRTVIGVAVRFGAFAVRLLMASPRVVVRSARFVPRLFRSMAAGFTRVLRGVGHGTRVLLTACRLAARNLAVALARGVRNVPARIRSAVRRTARFFLIGFGKVAKIPGLAAAWIAAVSRFPGRLGRRLVTLMRQMGEVMRALRRWIAKLRHRAPEGVHLGVPAAVLLAGGALALLALEAGPDGNFVVTVWLDLDVIGAIGAAAWLVWRVGRHQKFRWLAASAETRRVTVMWSDATRGVKRLLRSGAIAVRASADQPIIVVALLPGLRAPWPAPGTETLLHWRPDRFEGPVAVGREPPLLKGSARMFGPYRIDQPDVPRHVRRLSRRRIGGPAISLLVVGAAATLAGWALGNPSGATGWSSPLALLVSAWVAVRLAEGVSFNRLLRQGCDTQPATVAGLVARPGVAGWLQRDEMWLQFREAATEYMRVSLIGGQSPPALAIGVTANVYWRPGRRTEVIVVGSSTGATLLGHYETWSPEETVVTPNAASAAL